MSVGLYAPLRGTYVKSEESGHLHICDVTSEAEMQLYSGAAGCSVGSHGERPTAQVSTKLKLGGGV